MSDELATLPVTTSVEDVVRTMREHGCRRVPSSTTTTDTHTEQGRRIAVVPRMQRSPRQGRSVK
ncbi:CBS domain-containing protein [Sorangium sp. So ce381]|uniref:CBS domain-containing protein n=1 Tax=Sorangium sp. So ce381 TaxID=3133307 RepID=UPI003F5C90F4